MTLAVGVAVATAGPAWAQQPQGKAGAAVSADVEEAKRLNAEVERLAEQGKYEEALPLAQRALAMREKALGPNHADVAQSLNNLATLYFIKADYGRAEPLLQRALAIREKALGPDHPDVAESLNNLAELSSEKGDYGRAEPLFQRTLAIWEKTLGPDHPNVAQSLNNLAELYRARGDYRLAEPLLQRALAIWEKAPGPDHPGVAQVLNDLALLYRDKGDYGRAEPLFQRALAIEEKALGPDHRYVANTVNSLAELYRDKGDYGRAEPLYQRALAIREKALGSNHPDVAYALHNLARLYLAKGDYRRAEPLSQRALALRERALGPDHPDVGRSLDNLTLLYVAQGDIAKALRSAQQAIDIQDRNAAANLATGSEDQKLLYMNTLVDSTFTAISLHLQRAPTDPLAARLALTVLLRRKGRVLDAMTDSLALLRRSVVPADQSILDRLASVYAQISTQASRGPGKTPPEQYRQNLSALEHDRETLEAEISARSTAFRAEQHLVTIPDVQAKIPEGAALLEIARYKPYDPAARPSDRWGKPRYVAYILHASGEPTFADLGEAAPLEAAVEALRKALADHDRTHDPKPAARALDKLLMEPIRDRLGDTRWVFLSSDGPLNLIPFGALVDEQGHYLVERYLFSYLTTGRDLLRFGDQRARPPENPLVLANPAFDDSSAPLLPEGIHRGLRSIDTVTSPLPPLESTAAEARTIAELFPDTRVLLGSQATETAVKAAHAPRILHLATHGFFLAEQPMPEVLLARGLGGEPTPEERAAIAQRENPLLRSGLALAGFNKRQSGSDDGVLTALEVAGLDLHGTRLVTLSTCESGVGQATSGEGVYGLRRALVMAGAETQVMSLWQVDTGRTRELMQAYYQRLKGGAGRSEAMRDVQLAMLADPKTAHPNMWAGFILSGEWRSMEGEARLPEIGKVAPGLRGCSCEMEGEEQGACGAWLGAAVLGLAALRRRRLQATG